MSGIVLRDHQLKALYNIHNGCILNGSVGSGKSIAALAYYYSLELCKGRPFEECDLSMWKTGKYVKLDHNPRDLYIITTARKRDTFEWEKELVHFVLDMYDCKVIIDSWNNIKKYEKVKNAFFIFDEQRVIGAGAWVKSFLKIARQNLWILLSATPGDTWLDYVPVFIANGYYKNRTEFIQRHVVYLRNLTFPKIDRYVGTGRLIRLRRNVLVDMNDFERPAERVSETIYTNYDKALYRQIRRSRKDPVTREPLESATALCMELRKVSSMADARQVALLEIFEDHPQIIIFYNYDYELYLLKDLFSHVGGCEVAEWNGHKHQEIPDTDSWVYLVQYNAGAEGWNCIRTDTIVFYSLNYSYRMMEQAAGRIDRLNTPYKTLNYYYLTSHSDIEHSIQKALKNKKKFSEGKFVNNL